MDVAVRKDRVLVVDDEPAMLRALEALLQRHGYEVTAVESSTAASRLLAQQDFDVALVDVKMPEVSGLDLLRQVKHRRPEVEVIMMTGHATVETALQALKAGAYDYLTKPFDDVELAARAVAKAAERKRLLEGTRKLEQELAARGGRGTALIGTSDGIHEVMRMVDAVAHSSATVLVTGESGTGKELVARLIHERSPRWSKPFVAVNCGALTESLLESELFGHVRGAYTGAQRDQKGLFDAADSGTIFLDEIGDIAPATQVRLLRVLQEGEFKRVGAADPVRVDVRVIAATHRDLPRLVKSGRFREDLFYRLNVIPIPLPPLRDRIDDVPLLAHQFLRRFAERAKKPLAGISPEALDLLCGYRWPGNVRELENAIERAVILARGETLVPGDLPPAIAGRTAPLVREVAAGQEEAWAGMSYAGAKEQALHRFEKDYVEALMRACGNNISAAARKAGMDRSNFKRVLRKYRQDLDAGPDEADDSLARA